ncbi:hypothetical protein D0B88_15375 [Cellvibrio sp. KY-YJ-3]|nr:hypothetical protein D0B88_15375 [Cellvibrio sp. KY-YJ-3]
MDSCRTCATRRKY